MQNISILQLHLSEVDGMPLDRTYLAVADREYDNIGCCHVMGGQAQAKVTRDLINFPLSLSGLVCLPVQDSGSGSMDRLWHRTRNSPQTGWGVIRGSNTVSQVCWSLTHSVSVSREQSLSMQSAQPAVGDPQPVQFSLNFVWDLCRLSLWVPALWVSMHSAL